MSISQPSISQHSRALILTGGGARAAYQVGVLRAIADLLPEQKSSPFRVYSGTSAGAINATMLASNAIDYQQGMRNLVEVWDNFSVDQVYKTDNKTSLKNSMRWLLTVISAGKLQKRPMSILNNEPLKSLLEKNIRLAGIEESIQAEVLDGLIVICSAYYSALSVHFFQAADRFSGWTRMRRIGKAVKITLDHLMASAAIPFVFPAVRLHDQYYADGAVRQARPLSSVLNLDAERILVVGVRDERPNKLHDDALEYPSLGKITGYMLDTLFMDGLFHDLETVLNVNHYLKKIASSNEIDDDKKVVSTHIIVPSQDIREIAAKHEQNLPRNVRLLLTNKDDSNKAGNQLMSYLLFDKSYTRELMELGYHDGMSNKDDLLNFFCAEDIPSLHAPEHILQWFKLR